MDKTGICLVDIINRVDELRREPKLQEPMLGLMEEVGEVSTALNVKYHKKGKELTETPAEECVDVILSTLEIFLDEGGDTDLLIKHANFKLNRWASRLEQAKQKVFEQTDDHSWLMNALCGKCGRIYCDCESKY